MLIVRLIWLAALLPPIGVGLLYVSDPSTVNWYLYMVAVTPLVLLMFLRVMAIQKGRDQDPVDSRGRIGGSGPLGPP